MKSSKIQLCKGPPFEIFRSKKTPGDFAPLSGEKNAFSSKLTYIGTKKNPET